MGVSGTSQADWAVFQGQKQSAPQSIMEVGLQQIFWQKPFSNDLWYNNLLFSLVPTANPFVIIIRLVGRHFGRTSSFTVVFGRTSPTDFLTAEPIHCKSQSLVLGIYMMLVFFSFIAWVKYQSILMIVIVF